jgi:hypothetical protein
MQKVETSAAIGAPHVVPDCKIRTPPIVLGETPAERR